MTAIATESITLAFPMVPPDATSVVGGKGLSLSRMSAAGLAVPPGFVVCAGTFRAFLDSCQGLELVLSLTDGLDVHDSQVLESVSDRIRSLIVSAPLPVRIADAIR